MSVDKDEQIYITSGELSRLTGATFRQIDYWCTQRIIQPVERANPGYGYKRSFDPAIVNKVRLIVLISKAFDRENSPLKFISDNYEYGYVHLGNGITLTWDVDDLERGI